MKRKVVYLYIKSVVFIYINCEIVSDKLLTIMDSCDKMWKNHTGNVNRFSSGQGIFHCLLFYFNLLYQRNKDEKAQSLHGCTLHREEKVSLAIVN